MKRGNAFNSIKNVKAKQREMMKEIVKEMKKEIEKEMKKEQRQLQLKQAEYFGLSR